MFQPNPETEIITYAGQFGYPWRQWYAGITNDAKRRLFDDHGVAETGRWIYRTLPSVAEARRLEAALLRRGMDGGAGGGDNTSTVVYAYLKTGTTNP